MIQSPRSIAIASAERIRRHWRTRDDAYLFEEPGEEPKEIIIKIDGYKFGHNDFQVFCEGYYNVKSIKRIVYELKDENKMTNLKGNGHGTALVFDYDCYKELS